MTQGQTTLNHLKGPKMKNIMSRTSLIFITLLAATLGSTNALAKDLKIGVVDVQSIVQQLPQMATIRSTIENEFRAQVESLQALQSDAKYNYDKLQREGATMSTAQQDELKNTILGQQKKLEETSKPLQQAMERRGQEEQTKVFNSVGVAIEAIAKNKGYNLILHRTAIAYIDADMTDISAQVVARVKK
jgi:outer membrane protein